MIVAMKHEKRRFVEHVDFVTSPGFLRGGRHARDSGLPAGGMYRVVTDLGGLRLRREDAAHEGAGAQSRRHARAGAGQHRLRARFRRADRASPSRRPSTSSQSLRELDPDRLYHGLSRMLPGGDRRWLACTAPSASPRATSPPIREMPDAKALVEYGVQHGGAGFRLALGVGPHPARRRAELPDHRLADAAHRDRGAHERRSSSAPASWCCRCAIRWCSPSSSRAWTSFRMGGCSWGWRRAGTSASSTPSACRSSKRGKIMDENLDILKRFWTEHMVKGEWTASQDPGRRDVSEAGAEAASADPDRRLRRPRAQARGRRGDGWLTYFYRPESFAKSWAKIRNFARKPARIPTRSSTPSQLPIMIGKSRAGGREPDDGVARQGVGFRRRGAIDQGQRHHRHRRRMRRATARSTSPSACRRSSSCPTSTRWTRSRSSPARSFRG